MIRDLGIRKQVLHLLLSVMIICCCSILLNAQTLQLLRTIPKTALVDQSSNPPHIEGTVEDHDVGDYGFLWSGKAVYFGQGGWIYDLEQNDLRCEFPKDLHNVILSMDGNLAFGYTTGDAPWRMEGSVQRTGKLGAINGPVSGWFCIHPSNAMIAAWDMKYRSAVYMDAIDFCDARTGNRLHQSRPGPDIAAMEGFTADGRILILDLSGGDNSRLFDLRIMRLVPTGETQDIPRSDTFVFNRDASWVAGEKGANDYSTFVWDRKTKKYLWKSRDVSTPCAFSPNDKYLLCDTMMVEVVTGKTAFAGLKGHRGKFSPDGRSIVTVDDEAFYIYTLPKDSEPIFGVFQKPEPWAPPSSKKPVRMPSQKTTQKP